MSDYTRCCAKIDLNALHENFENIHKAINKDTKVVAVIKANGYGHGSVAIARELEDVDYIWGYATAAVSEAVTLREAGIKKPILILGVTFPDEYETIVRNDLRLAVFTTAAARLLSRIATELGKKAYIHIKIDTGMGRIGYQVNEAAADEILAISGLPGVDVEGIFTHFSKADETDKSYVRRQIDKFNDIINMVSERGLNIPLKHCSNSAGIIELPEVNMDLVRAGIIIYGLWPSDEVSTVNVPLKPVMSLYSRIVHIKECEPGSLISYGGTYETAPGDIIATVSFGYADGYPRSLSNKGYVLVRGHKAPIVGRVCMDQFMINVKGIPDVAVFDEVTLLGRDGEEIITMEELGDLSGRFNYEFACDINDRVPRIYIR